ncbi:uncharacterized protein [Amphiura filiformis]|uniref:uncharacterized protein n=1 Tax=Amphiura filiformis TaxID=82378 RepID=UPI003B215265
MECPYSEVGILQIGIFGLRRISLKYLHLVGFVFLLAFSPTCVLSQDSNYSTTTEMAEYTFLAGTTQSPQPSPGISESSPLNTQRPYTLPALINRTVFDMWFEQYKERSPGNFTQPFQECLYRQTLESFYLDFDLGEKGT